MMKIVFVGLLTLALLSTPIEAKSTQQLPIEAYAGLPAMSQLDLSPSGNKLAYLANLDGTLVLMAFDFNTKQKHPIIKTDNKNIYLGWFQWLDDNRLLISAQKAKRKNKVRYHTSQLWLVDLAKDMKLKPVIRYKKGAHIPQFADNIISPLPDSPNNILMQLDLDNANRPGVYKVNIETGRYKRILRSKSHIQDWIADRQGQIRMAYGLDGTKAIYRLYNDQKDSWQTLYEFELFSPETIYFKGFDKDPNIYYFTALHEGRYALFRQSIKDTQQRELIHADPLYDVEGDLIYSDKTDEVIGFAHSNAQDSVVYWDNKMKNLQKSLGHALPDSHNMVIDASHDGNHYLVYHSSDTEPGVYLIGNRKNKTLDFIGARYRDIDESNYQGKTKISYTARDGLKIDGYLTRPTANQEEKTLPTIILPHGGPHSRDFAGFDYWSELFANRGYLVLQPNFRGSSGYGYEFEMNAMQDWGGAMQDDLEDAAKYLIDEGLADPERICIAGGSYGGYAAIMAIVKHPKTFKCAASFAGVTDLEQMVARKVRHFTNGELIKAQFGDNDDMLAKQSPINYVEKINRPLLLIHGDDDAVVFVAQSRDMVDKLESANKDYRYIELEDGNHHLSNQAHRITTLTAFVEFFDKHLKQ